jgi:hypothetical protein
MKYGLFCATSSGNRPKNFLKVSDYSALWLPSQYGGFWVCLHWQMATVLVSAKSNLSGVNGVVLCDPSQKLPFSLCPQAHQ